MKKKPVSSLSNLLISAIYSFSIFGVFVYNSVKGNLFYSFVEIVLAFPVLSLFLLALNFFSDDSWVIKNTLSYNRVQWLFFRLIGYPFMMGFLMCTLVLYYLLINEFIFQEEFNYSEAIASIIETIRKETKFQNIFIFNSFLMVGYMIFTQLLPLFFIIQGYFDFRVVKGDLRYPEIHSFLIFLIILLVVICRIYLNGIRALGYIQIELISLFVSFTLFCFVRHYCEKAYGKNRKAED